MAAKKAKKPYKRPMTNEQGTQKTYRFPQKVLDNIEAIKLLTGDNTTMGVLTHAVAAYLYGLTQRIVDVQVFTEESMKDSAIINNIPAPVSDLDYWRSMSERNNTCIKKSS